MKQFIFLLGLLLLPLFAFAAEGPLIALENVTVNIRDKASVERGAKFYAQNCMSCHTMRYLEHNKIAKKAGITLDKMPLKQKEWWLSIVPPDLTLIARKFSPNWLYTYFHSFYEDKSRPTGFNNLLANNVNMTNVFAAYQGVQEKVPQFGSALDDHFGLRKPHYYTVLKLVRSGSMTPDEFDQTMTDLVNFLVYASEPKAVERKNIGIWVLTFLAILFVLAYFLKKEYWKDV